MITLFALIASTTWIFLAALSFWRWKDLESLVDIQNPEPTKWPLVSILVPARDEEEGFEKACRSLLALDYPNLESLRRQPPAWRLLTAEHAPLVASFLHRVFITPHFLPPHR